MEGWQSHFPSCILRWPLFSGVTLSSSSSAEASASLVKTKQRQECWWGLHLFLFIFCTPGIFSEGPRVEEAFSSSSVVCGMTLIVARASKHLHFTPSVNVHTFLCLGCVFFFSFSPPSPSLHSWEPSPVDAFMCKAEQGWSCFCAWLHSRGSGITWIRLWNWNWHLASHCFLLCGFDVFSKRAGACVCLIGSLAHVRVSACELWLSSLMCVGICLMCVQPYRAGRWIP